MTAKFGTDWQFIPSVELGGDTFGYYWLDDDHFAMYVLDVCGHGVKAALLSISAMNVLRNQTLPATDFRSPASGARGHQRGVPDGPPQRPVLHDVVRRVRQEDTRQLTYANGGHPSAILIAGASAETRAAHRAVESRHDRRRVPGQ